MQESVLRKGRNKKQLENDIDKTPAGLNDLYNWNWEKISTLRSEEKTRAISLLRWAAFSLRPLTVYEITKAVLIRDDYDNLSINNMPDTIDNDYIESEILGLCGSLIEVRGTSPRSMVIKLAHFSVKQFLLGKITSQDGGIVLNESMRRSNEAGENIRLAKLCLRYISFQQVWEGFPVEDGGIGTSLQDYAARSWHQHATTEGMKDIALLKAINTLFDKSS